MKVIKKNIADLIGHDLDWRLWEVRGDCYYTLRELCDLSKPLDLSKLYWSFTIYPRTKLRKRRKIQAPCPSLKKIQKKIYRKILINVAPHPAATAYFFGRSIAMNARPHLGCKYLYKTDISNFFPSICANIIQKTLTKHFPDLADSTVSEIVRFATLDGALPQGAPTSPHIANLVLYDFDRQLYNLCERIGACYTRYADDITVSADDMEALSIVEVAIRSGLSELGLEQHLAKTHLFGPNVRKTVTGLDVSGETIRPTRKFRKKSAAMVRICVMLHKRNVRNDHLLHRTLGYLSHWQSIAPDDMDLKKLKVCMEEISF